jgi:hypothetical protein
VETVKESRKQIVEKYVLNAKNKGYTDQQIKEALQKSGIDYNFIGSFNGKKQNSFSRIKQNNQFYQKKSFTKSKWFVAFLVFLLIAAVLFEAYLISISL